MLNNTPAEGVALLGPGAKADTAAATGGWISVANYEGTLLVTQAIGTVTAGQIAGKLQSATDSGGTGVADIAGATFAAVTTANDPATETIRVNANALPGYIRYVGTITTGPVDAAAFLMGSPKY